jgi:hypothetical protein
MQCGGSLNRITALRAYRKGEVGENLTYGCKNEFGYFELLLLLLLLLLLR